MHLISFPQKNLTQKTFNAVGHIFVKSDLKKL